MNNNYIIATQKELDEIKSGIEKTVEKQHRLANLMGFYTGEFAQ